MKKFILALALLICTNSVSLVASDLSDAKRSLKSAQKELSSVTSKRDKAQKKQNELQADYEESLAKMAANQDKPKSLAYKDAVKKSETLPEKLEQNAAILSALNRQVDSLAIVVANYESALNNTQAETEKRNEEQKTEVEESIDNTEKTIELPVSIQSVNKSKDKEIAHNNEQNSTPNTKKESAEDESSLSPFWTWVLMIGCGILFIWLFWIKLKRSLRCPKCGRWFAYDKDGVKVLHKEKSRGGGGWEIVYEKRFRCRHCGHKRTEKGTYFTSKPTLPSEWY